MWIYGVVDKPAVPGKPAPKPKPKHGNVKSEWRSPDSEVYANVPHSGGQVEGYPQPFDQQAQSAGMSQQGVPPGKYADLGYAAKPYKVSRCNCVAYLLSLNVVYTKWLGVCYKILVYMMNKIYKRSLTLFFMKRMCATISCNEKTYQVFGHEKRSEVTRRLIFIYQDFRHDKHSFQRMSALNIVFCTWADVFESNFMHAV